MVNTSFKTSGKKTVAIIFGGASSEYPVSLSSASSVISHLKRDRYDLVLIGITREGRWLRYYGDPGLIEKDEWQSAKCVPAAISPDRSVGGLLEFYPDGVIETRLDAVFPVLHGKNGEDGTIQGLLELAGIKYVGSGVMSSSVCMDKDIAHIVARDAGFRVPKFITVFSEAEISEKVKAAAEIGFPLYVKPVNAGSSIGISKVSDMDELLGGINEAFKHDSKVTIEENIEGFEVGCAVFGNASLTIGEVDEIEVPAGFFDYTEKYNLIESSIHVPARISGELSDRIKDTALRLYRLFCCKDMARIDMFLTPEGEIVFNEINTIPGFTSHSRYPSMLKAIGISYSEMLDIMFELAING